MRKSYKKTQIYAVMKRVDEEESVARNKGQEVPWKLSWQESSYVVTSDTKANIFTIANEGPHATFHQYA